MIQKVKNGWKNRKNQYLTNYGGRGYWQTIGANKIKKNKQGNSNIITKIKNILRGREKKL